MAEVQEVGSLMGPGLSMAARREITKKQAGAYQRARKKDKGRILTEICDVTGWSRANARRQLTAAAKRRGPASMVKRRARERTYGYDTLKVLQRVWEAAGRPCGKYLAVMMPESITNFEAHSLRAVLGGDFSRWSEQVRADLLTMSPATIDRMLAPHKHSLEPKGKTTTRSRHTWIQQAVPIMAHIDEIDYQPGLIQIDTVAHCGTSTAGEYLNTITATDVCTGWTINVAIRNKAAIWVTQALDEIEARFPYPIDHLHSDNGSEFLNAPVHSWCLAHHIEMSRSRPEHKNDNPFAEQKNGAIVRKAVFCYRYDTLEELDVLTQLWEKVNLRKNLFLPTIKATGWATTRSGRRVRAFDTPRTPAQRVCQTGILLPPQRDQLDQLIAETDLAVLTRQINDLRHRLIVLAAAKTQAA